MTRTLALLFSLFACAAFASPNSAIKAKSAKVMSRAIPTMNLRFFPSNTIQKQLHLAVDFYVSSKVGLGIEGAYGYNWVEEQGDGVARYKESYAGAYAQYYFWRAPSLLFVELGANISFAEGEYEPDEHPTFAPDDARSDSATLVMPHLTVNFRSPIFWGGFNASGGIGVYSYIGEKIHYPVLVDGYFPTDAGFQNGIRPRIRLDLAYAF